MRADPEKKSKGSEFVRWFTPLLQALKDLGGSAAPREALQRIAEIEKVPEALRNEVHWARRCLVGAGLKDSGRRGVWTLTPTGRAKLRKPSADVVRASVVQDEERPPDTPQADEDAILLGFLRVVKSLSPSGFERVSVTGRSK